MTDFLQQLDVNSRERIALTPGRYGTTKAAGLKVLEYIVNPKASRFADKDPELFMHSFLVAATVAPKADGNGAATAIPGDVPDGTAFLKLNSKEQWKDLRVVALAFGDPAVAALISTNGATQAEIDTVKAYYQKLAADKVAAANTPAEEAEAATTKAYENLLTQVRIAVGEVFRLQDWKGVPRNANFDPQDLVGIEFSGSIEAHEYQGKTSSEVASISSKKA